MEYIQNVLNLSSLKFYCNLDQKAQKILDFAIPPKSIQIGKQISPEMYSHYSLGHGETFFGYAFKNDTRILYGRLYRDGRLDGLYCNQYYKDILTIISGTSGWDSDSHAQLQIIANKAWFTNELTVNTDMVVGYTNLFSATNNWTFGGELFYTFAESSGGSTFYIN